MSFRILNVSGSPNRTEMKWRTFPFLCLWKRGGACATEVHRLMCVLSQSSIIFKHDFLSTQIKITTVNQQRKQPLQETAFQTHYSRNSEKKQTKKKTRNKANTEFLTCHIVPWASFLSQKATYVTRFVVIKITDVSSGCQRVNQAKRKKGRKTRKPRDIITSPDHAHMTPAASQKTVEHTRTRLRARCQTKHKAGGRLEPKR